MATLEFINRVNADYVDALYHQYLEDPQSVDSTWQLFFAGFEAARGNGAGGAAVATRAGDGERIVGIFDLVHSYRELGYLVADLDPLGHNPPFHPLLAPAQFGFTDADLKRTFQDPGFTGRDRATLEELLALLMATYCSTFAVEYMEISQKEQRSWLQDRMEPALNRPLLSADDRKYILSRLVAAEGFEHFLHTKFVGQKRFSLEGAESLIPLLDAMVEEAANDGAEELVLGMPHRGRLNVLAHTLRKPYEMILAEFLGTTLPSWAPGDGDVKYHLGYSRDFVTRSNRRIHLSLCSNPSHLEAIDPVVEGIVRAKQQHIEDSERVRVIPVLIHGDAAFTGQGVVAETMGLSALPGFCTGGTIHLIVNNQVGFTTSPLDYRSTCYPSDSAKTIQAPVFHVNGDDPEAAVQAARLAIGFRNRFKKDIIIHVVCYRRHGHNETDEPAFTQPRLYKEIATHPTTREIYQERLIGEGVITVDEAKRTAAQLREVLDDALEYARDFMPRQQVLALGGLWKGLAWPGADWSAKTAVAAPTLVRVARGLSRLPEGFNPHPKLRKLLEQRFEMMQADGQMDWSCGELLTFGTLLLEGTNIRLSGQDSGRGTFSHRHAVVRDMNTGERYVPLNHLDRDQGQIEVVDSMLSENAVLGFEYGFSSANPRNLVIWEAQFGDFANGAQVIIDQFIASGESKWQRMNGLVMLLPHGYEGQGPEHSSARLERYLQLCAENNLQVCNLTTPAQYFHALRRQMHRNFRKPLIVMTPKSLLRHKLAVSNIRDLIEGSFQPVLGEADAIEPNGVRRVLLCSGKIYYDLLVARRERDIGDIAICRVEQLYPFPGEEISTVLKQYPNAREFMWVQEEPWNQGAWHDMYRRLRRLGISDESLGYSGRRTAASPATGSYKVHRSEEADILNNALRKASYVR